ncbi:MAG: hypothetical protein EA396_12385 [Anaerolineaceae bacterium]|nr:MAG: hypothetical protein EA396_12385 [Anaerolineaceae bacterium]
MPMQSVLKLRIFLSSPGDVAAERKIAREVLEALNNDPFIKGRAIIEPIAWDAPGARVLMPVSLTPQEAIDSGLAKPSETDAVIVLLWGRMGTPLDVERHGKKPDGEPYWSGTEWEYLDAVAGAAKHPQKLPIVLVYRRTDTPPTPEGDDLDLLAQWIEQRKRVKQFFEPFRDAVTGAYRGNINEYTSPDDFRTQFEQDARLLAKELLAIHDKGGDIPPPDTTGRRINWTGSPFPGLRAFTEKDEPIFFGRGYETADLIKRLSKQRLMFVVGASGSGKSSLVGAGVIPQLQRGAAYGVAGWHIARFTPGDNPFKRLSLALLGAIPTLKDMLADDDERAEKLADTLRKAPEKLAQQAEKWLADEPDGTEILLFIDQFEELFTGESDHATAFAGMLQATSPQIRIIATMRSDFYERALLHFEAPLRDASYTLGTPSALALYEMIVRPAEVAGLQFEAGLAERIVTDTGDKPGNLALMAYALDELYKLSGDGHITHADYDALGGVQGAIGTRAEQTYAALSGTDDEKAAWIQRVFHELVAVDERGTATRRRVPAGRIAEDDREAVKDFVEARLLVSDASPLPAEHSGEGAGMRAELEVAHEALFRSWERLRDWIASAQEDLILLRQVRTAAHEWEAKGRPDFLLWPQERLTLIYAMQERLRPELSEVERDFIEPEQERLYRELEILPKDATTHERRRDIGDRLAVIGDTRPGVGVKDGLPDMVWLPVEGSGGEVEFRDEDGKVYGKFEVKPFYIARYLVTYAQYQVFAESDYDNPRWWDGFPEKYRPQKLGDQRTKIANAPRDTISWYQSIAFARWLDAQLRDAGSLPDAAFQVRLPTEWEWQWAVMGSTEAREYPWLGGWQEGFANTSEAGLNRTTAVGMYPHGAAVCGALDMSGNLWEWCLNDYNNPQSDATNKNLSSGAPRVLRGGAFYLSHVDARAAVRYDLSPVNRYYNRGFRVFCVRPPFS